MFDDPFRDWPEPPPASVPPGGWTVSIATALIAFVLLGLLPRIQW